MERSGVERNFARDLAVWAGVVAVGLYLVWQLLDIFVLGLGAVVIAAVVRSVAEPIRARTRLGDHACVGIAIALLAAAAAGMAWLFSWRLGAQLSGLTTQLPFSLAALRSEVASWPFGDFISSRLLAGGADPFHALAGRLSGYAMNAVSAAFDLLVIVFIGLFLAFSPGEARDGALLLFPRRARAGLAEAIDLSGQALRLWVRGAVVQMLIIGLMTGLGAWAVGLPAPFALGLIGGVAEVAPFIGPVLSAIPGLLLALEQGGGTVLWTLAMYLAIHQLEGNLIYPFIQRRAVKLPPVLTLAALLVFRVLFGPIGVVLAAPLLVVALTFVKTLYLRRTLGEPVEIAGEEEADEAREAT